MTTIERRECTVDLRGLKSVTLGLPRDHPLRIIMMTEDDGMEVNEFLAKIRSWLKLLQIEP